jgi:hypothetical protein
MKSRAKTELKLNPFAKRFLRGALCLSSLPAMTGCFTYGIWHPACQSRAVHPEIAGLVRNYPVMGNQSIVVTYRALGDWHDVNLLVPLDEGGNPTHPFAAQGTACVVNYLGAYDFEPVAGRLTADQMTEIFARVKTIGSDRELLAKHFNAVEWFPVAGQNSRADVAPEHPGSVCILAFKVDDARQIVPVPIEYQEGKPGPIHLPAGTHLLLVPTSVDRPNGDQAKNESLAVILTPFTVAADTFIGVQCVVVVIIVAPVVIPILAFGGDRATTRPTTQAIPATQPALRGPITVPIEIGTGNIGQRPRHREASRRN